jgi:hypothetical protein
LLPGFNALPRRRTGPYDRQTEPNGDNILTVKLDVCLPAIRVQTDRAVIAALGWAWWFD